MNIDDIKIGNHGNDEIWTIEDRTKVLTQKGKPYKNYRSRSKQFIKNDAMQKITLFSDWLGRRIVFTQGAYAPLCYIYNKAMTEKTSSVYDIRKDCRARHLLDVLMDAIDRFKSSHDIIIATPPISELGLRIIDTYPHK